MSIGIFLGPVIMLVGYLYWKKTGEKKYYWSIYPIGLGWCVTLYRHFSDSFLEMSQSQRDMEFNVLFSLYILAGLLFLIILFRK